MPKGNPLTDEQKKFIDENYKTMTVLDMSVAMDQKNVNRVYQYCRLNDYRRIKALTEEQKQYIRDHYLKMTEAAIMKKIGITRIVLQKFKREESLFTYPKNRKEKKAPEVKEMFFDVDARECWVA